MRIHSLPVDSDLDALFPEREHLKRYPDGDVFIEEREGRLRLILDRRPFVVLSPDPHSAGQVTVIELTPEG